MKRENSIKLDKDPEIFADELYDYMCGDFDACLTELFDNEAFVNAPADWVLSVIKFLRASKRYETGQDPD